MSSGGERPYTLVAELTYACPLRCAYCSNPVSLDQHRDDLSTRDWQRVFHEAEALGVVQCNLTGGEPLLRRDLEQLVRSASELDLYVNLATSGFPLERERLRRLTEAGLASLQISLQDTDEGAAIHVAGAALLDRKLDAARWAKELGLSLTVNVVLHAQNIDRVSEFLNIAETLKADRVELANVQYIGWALQNRGALMPTDEQLTHARQRALECRERLVGLCEVLFVTPDHHTGYPRSCMQGWGRRYIVISPDGLVLPCHAAHTIPTLCFDDVRGAPLERIWTDSPALNAFRGERWMRDPCRDCDRRHTDFGGCRCQAFHLTGDASATDPACRLSPQHWRVTKVRRGALAGGGAPLQLRRRSA